MLVLCEAIVEVEQMLRQTAVAGNPDERGLEKRSTHEHWVVRGNERETAVLVAARKDNTDSLVSLEYDVHDDHDYKEKKKTKTARSRTLVCRVGFKQSVGHLGREIVVCGVHGHYRTMKMEWPTVWRQFWDRLAHKIRSYGIQFMAGDFNMSFTQVVKELRSRGILCDCVAWYPWVHNAIEVHGQPLGMDSQGIFYIGGSVEVILPWSLKAVDILTAVADKNGRKVQEEGGLDVYETSKHPGQHWSCYRSIAYTETQEQKDLLARLSDLLTPSTSAEELKRIPRREGVFYCPYLRLKHKPLDKSEWLVGGGVHLGAHFPLCMFTENARARSKASAVERAQRKGKGASAKGDNQRKGHGAIRMPTSQGKGKNDIPAVAANTYFGNPTDNRWGTSSSSTGWTSSRNF